MNAKGELQEKVLLKIIKEQHQFKQNLKTREKVLLKIKKVFYLF